MFRIMYPDALFFGLIRNGLAIAEGYIRRGGKAEETGKIFNIVVKKMLEYQSQMLNYQIVRYEDMVTNPAKFVHKIYEQAGLDIQQLEKIRLQSKRIKKGHGKHDLIRGSDRQVFWYSLADLPKHIRPDINENQIRRISACDRAKFLLISRNTMEELGYAC